MDNTTAPRWQVGQQAVIDRRQIVTIDRVTKGGRAVVGERTFEVNGMERSADSWRRAKLEPLTDALRAEMKFMDRSQKVARQLDIALVRAERWSRLEFGGFNVRTPDIASVEKAERLNAAIREMLDISDE